MKSDLEIIEGPFDSSSADKLLERSQGLDPRNLSLTRKVLEDRMYNKGSQDRKKVGGGSSSIESLDKFVRAIRGKGRLDDLKKNSNFMHNIRN